MKVRVYFNLHTYKWSVQKRIVGKGWRVSHHTDKLLLKNVSFKVYENGRQKVIQEKRKNVHAYVLGEILDLPVSANNLELVYYNPYKVQTFVKGAEPIHKAEFCYMENKKVYV